MKDLNQWENTGINDPVINSTPLPNPFTLFLILILLINSFGGIEGIMEMLGGFLFKKKEGSQ